MWYDTSVIILLLGNRAPLQKQLRHDLYFLTPKGKNPRSYSFVKSSLQTNIKFTFLLKLQVRKAEPVKRSHGASSVTVIQIWAFRSFTELWHINAVQAFRKSRIPTTSSRTYLIKTIPPSPVCSTCNPTWPFLPITEKDTWATCQVILWNLKAKSMDFQ